MYTRINSGMFQMMLIKFFTVTSRLAFLFSITVISQYAKPRACTNSKQDQSISTKQNHELFRVVNMCMLV